MMTSIEAETLIRARSSTVWEVITDVSNITVWDSGITALDGELRDGGRIRIRTPSGGKRTFHFRVRQIPGQVMVWTALPGGLSRTVCTFTLTPRAELTHFRVRQDSSRSRLWPSRNTLPLAEEALTGHVTAVKKRAELLDRQA